MVIKERHLVDDLNRGAKTDSCKLCGVKITSLARHLKWHNDLEGMLKRLIGKE